MSEENNRDMNGGTGVEPPSRGGESGGVIRSIKLAWQGKEKLWIVFWIYFESFRQLEKYLQVYIFNAMLAWSIKSKLPELLTIIVPILSLLPFIILGVIQSVMVWRCAFNCKRKIFGMLARARVIFYIFTTIKMLFQLCILGLWTHKQLM